MIKESELKRRSTITNLFKTFLYGELQVDRLMAFNQLNRTIATECIYCKRNINLNIKGQCYGKKTRLPCLGYISALEKTVCPTRRNINESKNV